jgi:O-antigen/teichoic acid export membrane protein
MPNSKNHQRIAKNTLFLYVRMFMAMLVSLYTSRIVLSELGVTDFGIYNVVTGIVTLFAVLSATLANSTQRFLCIQVGDNQNTMINTQSIFSQFVLLHFVIAITVFVLSETIGVWFFFDKLNIPETRQSAAFVVYQISILLFVLNILKAPYDASLIVRQNMKIYAYIGMFEVVAKLLLVYMLSVFNYDKLILYTILTAIVSIIAMIITVWYVLKNYPEFKFVYCWDGVLFKSILKFVGWNYLTAIGDVTRMQGINIILNIFFGPAVNAARGIAFQIQASLIRFVTGFQTSVNPQLVILWSQKEEENMIVLMARSSKFSFFLLLLFSAPVIINCDYILSLWLKEPPEFTSGFCKLVLLQSLLESMCYPMWTVIGAIGKLRFSHIIGTIFYLLIVVMSYFILKIGGSPLSVFIISIIFIVFVMTMLILRINYLVYGYLTILIKQLVIKPILVIFPMFLLYFFMQKMNINYTLTTLLASCVLIMLFQLIILFVIGLDKVERDTTINFIKQKLR